MPDETVFSQDDEAVAVIPDLGGMPLEVIFSADDSALSNAVQRLLRDLRRPGEQYAAHSTTTG